MSYARLIQLLEEKKIKRIFIMADGQVAIVEVCFDPFRVALSLLLVQQDHLSIASSGCLYYCYAHPYHSNCGGGLVV